MYLYIKSRFYHIFSFYPNSVVGIVEVALERKRISGCRLSSPKITTSWRVKQEPRKRDAPAGYGQSYTCKKGKNR